ncbi:hypothetical protein D915_000473 [Fasciola hepatica]|uniref:Uncharacterized protein n=1 Tax=Fasciola hepatica TaxID=6192 RepID=A0A4E0RNY5_FASHE|nr:hypothetical protein D915_000473 [Fasciola hepatica]
MCMCQLNIEEFKDKPYFSACPSTKVTYCANPAPCVVKCSVDPKSSDIQKVECFAHQPSVPVRVAPECPCQATVAMQIKPKYVCPAPCPLACDKRVVSDDDAAACILHQLGFYDDGDDVDNCAVCQHAQPPVIVQTTPCCTPPVVSQVGYCGGSPVYAHVTPTTCAESVPVCTASVLTNVGCCGGSPASIVPHVSCCHGNAPPLFVCEIKRQTEKPKVKRKL